MRPRASDVLSELQAWSMGCSCIPWINYLRNHILASLPEVNVKFFYPSSPNSVPIAGYFVVTPIIDYGNLVDRVDMDNLMEGYRLGCSDEHVDGGFLPIDSDEDLQKSFLEQLTDAGGELAEMDMICIETTDALKSIEDEAHNSALYKEASARYDHNGLYSDADARQDHNRLYHCPWEGAFDCTHKPVVHRWKYK